MAASIDQRELGASPDAQTIGEAVAMIQNDGNVPDWRRRNVVCTINVLSHNLNRDLAGLPASAASVRQIIADIHPSELGLTQRRWGNLKNDLNFILSRAEAIEVPRRSTQEITPEWRRLLSPIGRQGDGHVLRRFARYCSKREIRPEAVDDAVGTAYLDALQRGSLDHKPQATHRRMVLAWNRATAAIETWPDRQLAVPDYKHSWTIPSEAYPDSFTNEVEAWGAWLKVVNPFDERARTKPLRPSTVKARKQHVRYAAGALIAEGCDPASITSLAVLVQPDVYEKIVRHLYEKYGPERTSLTRIVAVTLKIMAREWLGFTPEQLEPLEALCRKIPRRRNGMTERNRRRLRVFDDPSNLLRLLHLPHDELRRVQQNDGGTYRDALKVQTALAIESLLLAPVRLQNLTRIDVRRHLSWARPGRRGLVHLVIPADETKNNEPLEFELPKETVRLLETYLRDFHPRLTDGQSDWLFPGKHGRHKSEASLRTNIQKMILNKLGFRMHPHLFRHLAAKIYLDAHPGDYESVRRVLGHRLLETTTTFYAGQETLAATRHFDQTILKHRDRSILDLEWRKA